MIWCPTLKIVSCPKNVAMSKSLAELSHDVALVQGQPAGKERHQRLKRAITCAALRTGCYWTTTPPLVHAGRTFDVSRWKVGRIAPGAKPLLGRSFAQHHGSQLLAAVMDRWPSFCRFGSSKLPRDHPHVAVFIFILWVTYMPPVRAF